MNISTPWVRGVGVRWTKFGKGFPPREESMQVGNASWQLRAQGRLTRWGINLTSSSIDPCGGGIILARGSPLQVIYNRFYSGNPNNQ